jgi:hypothetical protein
LVTLLRPGGGAAPLSSASSTRSRERAIFSFFVFRCQLWYASFERCLSNIVEWKQQAQVPFFSCCFCCCCGLKEKITPTNGEGQVVRDVMAGAATLGGKNCFGREKSQR